MTTTPRTAETITAELLAMDHPRAALSGHLSAVIDIAIINIRSALQFADDAELSRRYFTDLLADLVNASQVKQSVNQAIDAEIFAKYGLSTPAHSKPVIDWHCMECNIDYKGDVNSHMRNHLTVATTIKESKS